MAPRDCSNRGVSPDGRVCHEPQRSPKCTHLEEPWRIAEMYRPYLRRIEDGGVHVELREAFIAPPFAGTPRERSREERTGEGE